MDESYLLFLLFTSNTNIVYIFIIFVYKLAKTYIEEYMCSVYEYFKPTYSIDIYQTEENNKTHCIKNVYYNYLSFFIENNQSQLKIHRMKNDRTFDIDNKYMPIDTYKIRDDYAIMRPTNNRKLYYNDNGISISILPLSVNDTQTSNITNNLYRIESKSNRHIEKFMQLIDLYKINYYKKMYAPKDPHCNVYCASKWNELPINCNKTFDNIFISESHKNLIKKSVENLANNEFYHKSGIPRKAGFLFHGRPGSGKTSTIYAIASEYRKQIYIINTKICVDNFYTQIREVKIGSIVVFNDIDTIDISLDRTAKSNATKKDDKDDKKIPDEICLGDLLEILDGYTYLSECIIIMTTNYIDKLDSALIRPGRIDHRIEFGYATNDQIHQILKFYYPDNDKHITDEVFDKQDCDISYIINTLIIPNIDDINPILDYLRE